MDDVGSQIIDTKQEPEPKKVTIADVAKAVGVSEDHLQLANYSLNQLADMFNVAGKSEKRIKYISDPAMNTTAAIIGISMFVDQSMQEMLILPLIVAALAWIVPSKMMDTRPALRERIKDKALERGVELFKQNNLAP